MFRWLGLCGAGLLLVGAGRPNVRRSQPVTRPVVRAAKRVDRVRKKPSVRRLQASHQASKPTLAEARRFMAETERQLRKLLLQEQRTGFVYVTYITHDTQQLSSQATEAVMAYMAKRVKASLRFRGLKMPASLARKFQLLRLRLGLPAPSNPALRRELAQLMAKLESMYGTGKYCKQVGKKRRCLGLGQLEAIMAKSHDPKALLDAWRGWRTISVKMKPLYVRFVKLANLGAREMGFRDLGELWKLRYDMSAAQFATEMERLWKQVKPLYRELHCFVRARLAKKYGTKLVPPGRPIPAHLLGNMWAQSWAHLFPLLLDAKARAHRIDITRALRAKKTTPKGLVRIAEGFFTSLGMPRLPATFWKRSLFVKPRDRDVVCHASAWHIDYATDVRLKQCIKIDTEDFYTVHHELGHLYYYLGYHKQPLFFQRGAHDGFHEGIGDTISLSITPSYLKKIGLLPKGYQARAGDDLRFLLKMALEYVAFLPFGKLVDQWRWQVFSGAITPAHYNASWWALRTRYQGIAPPIKRSERDFDPGAKYHIPANVPYSRYFLATILQFQFHRALCQLIGHEGPLHTCSIYGNKKAGAKFWKMLQLGQSRPWPQALATLTGQQKMDASAILSYFAPLYKWLKQKNKGRRCGW